MEAEGPPQLVVPDAPEPEAEEEQFQEVLPPAGFDPLAKLPHRGELNPTDDQRRLVREMAVWGVPYQDIAQHIINPNTKKPIDRSTLTRNFREELDAGTAEANVKLASVGYLQAVGWPAEYDHEGNLIRPYQPPVPMMTKWQQAVRLGYKEKMVVEQEQTHTTESVAAALSNMTYDDMLQLREILQRTRKLDDKR